MVKSDIEAVAKRILTLVIISVIAISLVCVATAEEDFGCTCHSDIEANFSTSLHYTGAGMKGEYEKFAAKEFGIDMDEYYAKWNCSKCHATTCEKCHGEDLHEEDMSKNISTCDQCHKKKQSATFVGDMPAHKKKGPAPDIHYTKGLICTDCHNAAELHGDGNVYTSQLEAVTTKCEDCHNSPGKTVKNMTVTQYSTDIDAHMIHRDKLDCIACHSGWTLNCKNCHLDTRKGAKPVSDEFYLGVASDGKIKTFVKMEAFYDNASHMGYGEWFSHTVTDKAKDCAFCHRNPEVLCEGCEGNILGKGGSFIPQETIERVLARVLAAPIETPTPILTPTTTTFESAKTAIEEAKTKISEANSRGSDLTQAELLLEEAEQALENGDYNKAIELAKQAKKKAEMVVMAHNVLTATVIGVVIFIVVSVVRILRKR